MQKCCGGTPWCRKSTVQAVVLWVDTGSGRREDEFGRGNPRDPDSRACEAGSTASEVHERDSAAGRAREESGTAWSSDT